VSILLIFLHVFLIFDEIKCNHEIAIIDVRMKKYILLLCLIAFAVSVRGNIATPQAFISEILVDSTGNWTIELGFYAWSVIEIDSIVLETSSGSSRISFFTLIPGGGYPNFDSLSIISDINLENPLTINPQGDFVKLISFAWSHEPFDYVPFGVYPGSYLDCIQNGESVIYLVYEQSSGYTGSFCIDNSPTIGIGNDTTGALGIITGVIYDPFGIPFTHGTFFNWELPNTKIHIDSTGFYSERVFSRRFTFDTIQRMISGSNIETYTNEMVDFCLRPDSSHYQHIITTSLVTDIKDYEPDHENSLIVSPNPFSDIVTFYFNLKNNRLSDEVILSIYNLDGRTIHRIRVSPDQKQFNWEPDNSVSPGTYIYRLEKNNQAVKSGKFIKM
jgi:hypothetical protein